MQAAGLAETVSDDEAVITVLAPSNSAFAKIPQEQLDSILADKTRLASVRTHFTFVHSVVLYGVSNPLWNTHKPTGAGLALPTGFWVACRS